MLVVVGNYFGFDVLHINLQESCVWSVICDNMLAEKLHKYMH